MIKKKKEMPIYLLQLQALLRRLGPEHPNRREIEDELGRKSAGFRGEKSLDYDLSLLDEKKYLIFHDIRLLGVVSFFQIDHLIVSSNFIVVVQAKNMSGELFFEKSFNQLVQNKDGVEQVYSDPIVQVERQKEELSRWMCKSRFPQIPLKTLVVFTNSKAYIKASPGYTVAFEKVIRSNKFPWKMKQFEGKYEEEVFSKRELQKLTSLLLKGDTPYFPDVLKKFKIDVGEVARGVHCPRCFRLVMKRGRNKWSCSYCEFASVDAHLHSINDYYLLMGWTITNKELREFLQLSSRNTAMKILASLGVPHSGTFKDRKYHLKLFRSE